MNDEKDFDETIKMATVSLMISGIKIIEMKVNRYVNIFLNNWWFYFNTFWVQTDVLAEICWVIEGVKHGKSIVEVSIMGPCITLCLLSAAKLTPLFYNKDVLLSVVNKFKEIHPVVTIGEDGLDAQGIIVRRSTKLIYLTGLVLSTSILILGLSFVVAPGVIMMVNLSSTGETDFILPYFTKYFFDPNTKLLHTLVYVHQAISTLGVSFNVIGADTTFYTFCTFMRMHFQLLSLHFTKAMSFKSQEETTENLTHLIIRHQELIQLSKQMEVLFSKSILYHILSSSILICLCLFNLALTLNIGNIILFGLFLTMSLTHIFLVCYFGEMLMTSSTLFSESVYNCEWYNAELRVKKCVLFVLMRSQTPCKLTAAGFADLTMNMFTSILYKSWSYFALLRTMCD